MNQGNIDFQLFAHLRGKKAKSPLRWSFLVSGILFLSGVLWLLQLNLLTVK